MHRGALAVILCLVPLRASALDALVTGTWSETIGPADLAAGAGSDLVSTVTSGAGQVWIDVASATSATDSWRIDVNRTSTGWPAGLRLWARRSSDGTGPGTIAGGGAWQEISLLDTSFFTGEGDRTDIGVELRITGLSVALPPAARAVSVTYTVVDL